MAVLDAATRTSPHGDATLAPGAPARHGLGQCERNLKAMPNYSPFRGTPAVFVCACGRRFEYGDEESEGAAWTLVEPG